MVTLTKAHNELFRRGPDEVYESFDDLHQHCARQRLQSEDLWERPQDLTVSHDMTVCTSNGIELNLNDWSFSQLCRMAGVSKDTVNRLSHRTASRVFEETLPRSDKPLQVLTTGADVRSIHGVAYTRLWNADLLDVVNEFASDFTPPQKAMDDTSTGLYCGEQDLFAFMIDPTGWAEINGEAFDLQEISPGFTPQPDRPTIGGTDEQRKGWLDLRNAEATRQLMKNGDPNDPESIAGKLRARGEAKAAGRKERMDLRKNGPSDEQRLMNMAVQGNQDALRMLGMVAEGNKSAASNRGRIAEAELNTRGLYEQRTAEADLNKGKLKLLEDQSMRSEGLATTLLDSDNPEVRKRGFQILDQSRGEATNPSLPPWATDPVTGKPNMDQEEFLASAQLYGMPAEDARVIAAMLPQKERGWLDELGGWLGGFRDSEGPRPPRGQPGGRPTLN